MRATLGSVRQCLASTRFRRGASEQPGNGRTDRFDGSAWSIYRRGTNGIFDFFTMAGLGDVWGYGESGLVHYTEL